MLVVSAPYCAQEVARSAAEIGGEIRYQDDEIGYLRIRIPTEKASELSEFNGVQYVAMDSDESSTGEVRMQSWAVDERLSDSPAVSRPSSSRAMSRAVDDPFLNSYSPLGDIGAAQFVKRHPTFDGRGVTIAHIEYPFDLLLPEFQTAYTLAGRPIPKVADIINVTDPRDSSSLWVNMREEIVAQDRQVSFQGRVFTTPYDGRFRIGFFNEQQRRLDDAFGRIAHLRDNDGLMGVLWDEQTNDVWVDTNRDLNFADEKVMTDYAKRRDIGVLGKDDPFTPERETIGFTVQTDQARKFISINPGIGGHATSVLGSVIGNREPAGRLQGIAPGARIVHLLALTTGGGKHSIIEGLIAAFKHPEVDLISMSNSAIGQYYHLGDARHPFSIIVSRLSERYHKLFFVAAGNASGLGVVSEESLSSSALSVGAYQSQQSYRLNNGFAPVGYDHLNLCGRSHGPTQLGSLKPDILAPSGQLSTHNGYDHGGTIRGVIQLPPGYGFGGCTSEAAPMAAGAAALVLSAAKQTGMRFDAALLRLALVNSARYTPNLYAHEQGNGLVQVKGAYELLKKLQNSPLVTITSRAPVRTKLSEMLQVSNEGLGIYEREGWSVGDEGTRTITFTRTSGPLEPMTFSLNWEGNDGTFGSATSIVLPLNKPVSLAVLIAVKAAGPHSSILTLDNPRIPGHSFRVLNTVIGSLRFTRENKYTLTEEIKVPATEDRGLFFEVPPNVAALRLSWVGPEGGKIAYMKAISPSNKEVRGSEADGLHLLMRPEPGVWEINVSLASSELTNLDPGRHQLVRPAKVRVTAALTSIELMTDTATVGVLTTNQRVDIPVNLTNRFAPVLAGAALSPLGSAFRTKRQIVEGEQHVYEIVVPKGTPMLRALVSDVADPNADLDVYLLDCTEKTSLTEPCAQATVRARDTSENSGGEVAILNPRPGKWKVVVDAYSVPSGRTDYSYLDIFTHSQFGTVSVTDCDEKRESGITWATTAHVWVASLPESPRTLEASIIVRSPAVRIGNGPAIPLGILTLPFGSSAKAPTALNNSLPSPRFLM
jgi:hypothetical protein